MLNILVYTGAQTLDDAVCLPASANTNSAASCFTLLGKGPPRILCQGLPLVQTLAEQQTHYTGKIVKNRVGLPDAIRSPFTLEDSDTMLFRCD